MSLIVEDHGNIDSVLAAHASWKITDMAVRDRIQSYTMILQTWQKSSKLYDNKNCSLKLIK